MTAPLTDRDYAEIRARVHAQLARERRQRIAWRVAAAAAILASVLLLRAPRMTFPGAAPRVVTATLPDAPGTSAAPALAEAPAEASAGATAIAPVTPPGAATPETTRRDPRRASQPVSVANHDATESSRDSQPLRVEIETADPDVRIIWIINPSTEETL